MRIAVIGATGFQGGLTATELARRRLQPVLVGRESNRLKGVADALPERVGDLRVADLDDGAPLERALEGCAAVINCAGPFSSRGAAVVRAALAVGASYVDTSGEQLFIKSLFDRFGDAASRQGVSIVPAATDGAVPGDLLARLVAEQMAEINELVVAHKIVGGGGLPSRGSLRSAIETREIIRQGGLLFTDGQWQADSTQPVDELPICGRSRSDPC